MSLVSNFNCLQKNRRNAEDDLGPICYQPGQIVDTITFLRTRIAGDHSCTIDVTVIVEKEL